MSGQLVQLQTPEQAKKVLLEIAEQLGKAGEILDENDMMSRARESEERMNKVSSLLQPFSRSVRIFPYYEVGFGSMHSLAYQRAQELAGK